MKSKLLYLLILLFGTCFVYGQTKQDFESSTFPPEDWTIYHLLKEKVNSNGWTRQQQVKPGAADDKSYVAYGLNGNSMNDADSWLIAPKTLIKAGDHLNFMLKIVGAGSNTTDTLDVLLSASGKEKSDFTTRLLRIMPKNDLQWSQYCIDLSEYVGKEIHIAFRDHLMNPENYVVGCKVYLDDVEICDKTSSDLSVSSILSPRSECSTTQYVELAINNAGKTVNEFTVCCQVNGGEIVKEKITQTIESYTQRNIALKTPVEFVEKSKNSFKAWIECEKDNNAFNNSLSQEVNIDGQIPFPYDMLQRPNADADFTSYAIRSQWICLDAGFLPGKSWMYGGTSMGGFLGSGCLNLPKGKVRITLSYMASQHTLLKVSSAPTGGFDSYKEIIGESPILLGNGTVGSASFVVQIPREGLQSLGFLVCDPNDTGSGGSGGSMQIILNGIQLESLYEDIAIEEIIEPFGTSIAASEEEKDVKIKLSNEGVTDQTNFKLFYQLNDEPIVSEVYTKTLKSGESDDYSFGQKIKFNQIGAQRFKVWMESGSDVNKKNDSINKKIYVYESYKMPYRMSFEKGENIDSWTFINANMDAVGWTQADLSFRGSKVAYLSFVENIPNDDYLISPAIFMPAGKARISFFYMIGNMGTIQMEVLMGKTNQPKDLKTVLLTLTESTNGLASGYAPLDIAEAGYYYFGVHGSGLNGEIVFDDVRIDTEVDACVDAVRVEEKENYNLTTSAVSVVFSNHSAKNIQEAKVFYQLNGQEIFSEVIKKEMTPGEQVVHTFKQLADISKPGTHTVRGWVEVKDDVEEFNNIMSTVHEHYKNKTIPYFQNFEDATSRYKWNATVRDLNEDNNSWVPAGNAIYSAYSGTSCLYYDSNNKGNDWIFSECIEIPSGDFEFSFFYRTYKNFSNRKENFKIMLGTSPNPESMTIEVANFKETSIDGLDHMKVICRLAMAQEGKYYIGVYTDSPLAQGMIVIDDISIKRYEEKTPFYLSDFTNHFNEWTPYRLYLDMFDQWTKTSEGGKAYDIVQLNTFKTNDPGLFVSPGFKIEKDQRISLEMEYALLSSNANSKLGLYMGRENHPDSITTLIEELPVTTKWDVYRKEISVEKAGRYFFAVKAQRVEAEKGSSYKIGYLKLTPANLNSYQVKATLTDAAGNAIAGAAVDLIGGQSQTAVTDKDGRFVFAEVLDQQLYTLKVAKDKFITHTQSLKLEGTGKDLGAIVLKYVLLKPVNVEASLDQDQKVLVKWGKPEVKSEYRYDDGVPFGQVGFNNGTSADVMGTVFRTPAQINEISWFTVPIPGIHEKINVYILDLDKNGEPTNAVLYESTDVPNLDSKWCSLQLPEPINAPNGFMVAVSYNSGPIGLAIDDGLEDYPFNQKTCYIGNVLSGTFSAFESQGGKSNFLLRAKGTSIGSAAPSIVMLSEPTELLLSYKVYRLEKKEKANEKAWVLLTQNPVSQTTFTDNVSALNGDYLYAVKTVYPSKEESEATLSNQITIIGSEIATLSESDGLHLWPVCAVSDVTVDSRAIVKNYVIHTLLGTAVDNGQVNEKYFVIPVSKLVPGHYIISLYTENGKVDRRIIKQ